MRIVCVHGFGGKSYDSEIAETIRTRSHELKGLAVETYAWDSGQITSKWTVADWNDAQEKRKAEAPKLSKYLKERDDELVVVAFSLGCWLLLDSFMNGKRAVPSHISRIFFLGAAAPHTYQLRLLQWPQSLVAINYFSPRADWVLGRLYKNAMGIPAAGEVGFADGLANEAPVMNLRVHRAHSMLFNFHSTARTIAELICFEQGYRSTVAASLDEGTTTLGGGTFWDQVIRHRGLLIQRHSWFNHYRVLEESTKKRVAWSTSLSALLSIVYEGSHPNR